MFIYHITNQSAWTSALKTGRLSNPSLETEGFIHCCLEHQVNSVLNRYFQGISGLLLLQIDLSLLDSNMKFDWVEQSKESFPHVYGEININSISEVKNI